MLPVDIFCHYPAKDVALGLRGRWHDPTSDFVQKKNTTRKKTKKKSPLTQFRRVLCHRFGALWARALPVPRSLHLLVTPLHALRVSDLMIGSTDKPSSTYGCDAICKETEETPFTPRPKNLHATGAGRNIARLTYGVRRVFGGSLNAVSNELRRL